MNSPQLENGYLRIATEIMDALIGIRINGEARQVLDFILRKTYGFQKKVDTISLSQFYEMTGINRPCIIRAIHKLESMNLIIKKDNGKSVSYGFNKIYSTWRPLSKKITPLSKKITQSIKHVDNIAFTEEKSIIQKDNEDNSIIQKDNSIIQKDNKRYPKRYIQKKKETIQKKYIYSPAMQDIVSFLNEKAKTAYRATTKKTQSLIKARLNEGFTIDDFKKVIEKKTRQWLDHPDMAKYLRPETLFGTKFESYLNEKILPSLPENKPRRCVYDNNKPCYLDCPECNLAKQQKNETTTKS